MGIPKETLKCFVHKERAVELTYQYTLSEFLSQTNESCLCKSSSLWAYMALSMITSYTYIALIATSCVSLITSFQPPLHSDVSFLPSLVPRLLPYSLGTRLFLPAVCAGLNLFCYVVRRAGSHPVIECVCACSALVM